MRALEPDHTIGRLTPGIDDFLGRSGRAVAGGQIPYDAQMHSNEVFAKLSPEEAFSFLEELRKEAPGAAQVALTAASNAFKLRPQFLSRQPRERQAEWTRRALARRAMAVAAEEVLAEYFLGHKCELLTELLDALGIQHEEGRLEAENPPCPERAELEKAVERFREGDDKERRKLLLMAFAAQSAIDWPDLEALL